MMDISRTFVIGFANAVQPMNFLMIVLGLLIGTHRRSLPGITMINSIARAAPFTYLMGIVPACSS
jgi:putative tricarboxylic transport membrane protein